MPIATVIRCGAVVCTLLLSSCASKDIPCPEWQLRQITPCYPCYRLAKLYLPPPTPYFGLELEIICDGDDLRMYLNLTGAMLESCVTEVTVQGGDCIQVYVAEVLDGGQRVLLPSDAANQIIDTLLDSQSLTLRMGTREWHVISINFPYHYEQMWR